MKKKLTSYQIVLFILIIFANSYRIINTNFFHVPNVTTYLILFLFSILFIKHITHVKQNLLTFVIFFYIVWIILSTLINDKTQITYAITICIVLYLFIILLPCEKMDYNFLNKILELYVLMGTMFSIVVLIINKRLLTSLFSLDVYSIRFYEAITGNKNADGAILLFCIMSTFIIYVCTLKKTYMLLILLQAIGLVIMFSRTPLFSLMIFCLIFVLFYLKGKKKVITIASLITIIVFLSTSSFFTDVVIRPNVGLSDRNLIWNEALKVAQKNLFFGIGFNNWDSWKNYAGETVFVHNTFLQTVVDIGLPGLLFYLFINIFIIKINYDLINNASNRIERALTVGVFAANIAITAYSFFETNFIGGYKGIELNSIMFLLMVLIIKNNKNNYLFTKRHRNRNN